MTAIVPRRRFFSLPALFAAFVLLSSTVQAQAPQRQLDDAERETSTRREAEEAGQRARERRAFEGPTIGFQDVLRAPDDIALNIAFVRGQIRDGDLRGAASTLERILALEPSLVEARYLHAIVLLRLDSPQEAERELRLLQSLPLSPERRADVDRGLREVERRRQRVRWQASFSVGTQWDSNRDAAPVDRQKLVFGTPFASARANSDGGLVGVGQLRMTWDPGTAAGHEVFVVATGYRNWQSRLHQFELFAASVESGITFRTDLADVSPSVIAGYASLRGQRFQRSAGARLRVERAFAEGWTIFGDALVQHQEFDDVNRTHRGEAVAPQAQEMSGLRGDLEIGASVALAPAHRLAASYVQTRKEALRDWNAYDGGTLALRHTWLLGAGRFLLADISGGRDVYDGPEALVADRTRRDRIGRAQLGFGTPLEDFLPTVLAPALGDVTLLALVEARRARSNIVNYSYDNVRLQLMLTKAWEF
jgi:hypothetical protein